MSNQHKIRWVHKILDKWYHDDITLGELNEQLTELLKQHSSYQNLKNEYIPIHPDSGTNA